MLVDTPRRAAISVMHKRSAGERRDPRLGGGQPVALRHPVGGDGGERRLRIVNEDHEPGARRERDGRVARRRQHLDAEGRRPRRARHQDRGVGVAGRPAGRPVRRPLQLALGGGVSEAQGSAKAPDAVSGLEDAFRRGVGVVDPQALVEQDQGRREPVEHRREAAGASRELPDRPVRPHRPAEVADEVREPRGLLGRERLVAASAGEKDLRSGRGVALRHGQHEMEEPLVHQEVPPDRMPVDRGVGDQAAPVERRPDRGARHERHDRVGALLPEVRRRGGEGVEVVAVRPGVCRIGPVERRLAQEDRRPVEPIRYPREDIGPQPRFDRGVVDLVRKTIFHPARSTIRAAKYEWRPIEVSLHQLSRKVQSRFGAIDVSPPRCLGRRFSDPRSCAREGRPGRETGASAPRPHAAPGPPRARSPQPAWTARAALSAEATPGTKGSGRANAPNTMFCICSRSWAGEAEARIQPDSGMRNMKA